MRIKALIWEVRPGHYLICHDSGQIKEQKYWDMDYPNKVSLHHRRTRDESHTFLARSRLAYRG